MRKPMAAMLLAKSTIFARSHPGIAEECARADILVAAVGRAKMVKKIGSKGAIIIV